MIGQPPKKTDKADKIRVKEEKAQQRKAEKNAKKQSKASGEMGDRKSIVDTIKEKLPAVNYEFTKREKNLLYALGMVALLMAIMFIVVMPGLTKIQDLSAQKDEAQATKDEMELAISGLSANQMMLTAAQANLTAKQAAFAAAMNNAQIDNFVTVFVENSGLAIHDLAIENVTTETLPTFGTDAEASSGSADSSASTDTTSTDKESTSSDQSSENQSSDISNSETSTTTTGDSSTTATAISQPDSGVVTATVTVSFVSLPAAIYAVLDNAAAQSNVQVMALSYDATNQSGTITLNVYMGYQSNTIQNVQQTKAAQ